MMKHKSLPLGRKVCRTCQKELPLSNFIQCNFSYYADCKECYAQRKRMRYATDAVYREKQLLAGRAYKAKSYATLEGKYKSLLRKQQRRAAGSLTLEQWFKICKLFDNSCAYCGSRLNIEQEHIVPVSKGGKTSFGNIIPACGSCNRSKCNRDLIEWYRTRDTFTEERLEKILDYMEVYNEITQQ